MKKKTEVTRTIRLPKPLRDAATKRAAEDQRNLQQHIVYLLEQDVKNAKRQAAAV